LPNLSDNLTLRGTVRWNCETLDIVLSIDLLACTRKRLFGTQLRFNVTPNAGLE
jgi:hypothetical protein